MKCIKCGKVTFQNNIFNNSTVSELLNTSKVICNDIEISLVDDQVSYICPSCLEKNIMTKSEFFEEITRTETTKSGGTGTSSTSDSQSSSSGSSNNSSSASSSTSSSSSSASGSTSSASSNASSSSSSTAASSTSGNAKQTVSAASATTTPTTLSYTNSGNYSTDDISLPPYNELDYIIKRVSSVMNSSGSTLGSQIAGFSTHGLNLRGADSGLSSAISGVSGMFGASSKLSEIHGILKDVENKLRQMDSNYDLFVAAGYLDNFSDNNGELNILGSELTAEEQKEIFDSVNETLENNKDNTALDAETEGKIVGVAARAAITANNIDSAYVNGNELSGYAQTALNNMIDTVVKKYAKVKTFERTDGGGLFIEKPDKYTIGIPSTYHGQAMDTIIFFDDGGGYGAGGEKKYNNMTHGELDRTNFRTSTGQVDTLMSSNPNAIVAASRFGIERDTTEMLNIMSELGIQSNHTIVSGFSAGGNAAVTNAEKILKNYSNLRNVELLLLDTNNLDQVNKKTIKYLADNNVKVTTLNSLDEKYVKRKYHYLYDQGVDLSVIHTARTKSQIHITWHTDHKVMAFNDNLFGYMLGNDTAPLSSDNYGGAAYSYAHYNNQTTHLEAYLPTGKRGVVEQLANVSDGSDTSGGLVIDLSAPVNNNVDASKISIISPGTKLTENAKTTVNVGIDTFLKERGSSLEDYNNHITKSVQEAGYHTREGVVAAATSSIDYLYDGYGAKLPYYLANQKPTIFLSNGIASNVGSGGKSFDCSGFVTWALNNGGYTQNTKGNARSTITSFSDKIYSINSDFVGKPGDLIASNSHVQLIVATNVEKGTYTVAESRAGYGVVMKEYDMHSNEAHHGQTPVIVDMTPYYEGKS